MELLRKILSEENKKSDNSSAIPYNNIERIRKLIKKGAMDPDAHWSSALELVHTAYQTENVERPSPSMKEAWEQYEDILLFSVQQLQKATEKGVRDDSWKLLSQKLEDQINGNTSNYKQRYGI